MTPERRAELIEAERAEHARHRVTLEAFRDMERVEHERHAETMDAIRAEYVDDARKLVDAHLSELRLRPRAGLAESILGHIWGKP